MNQDKIHPTLPMILERSRTQILAAQAEEVLRFELADERVEEREYDEQERLRKHRIVNRHVVRGEALRRYATLAARMEDEGADRDAVRAELTQRFEVDLRSAVSEAAVGTDLAEAIHGYGTLVPPERWPAVLCSAEQASMLKDKLGLLGFRLLSTPLEKLSILKFACPPEMTVLRALAAMPSVQALASPATPIRRPQPSPAAATLTSVRGLLGVSPEMTRSYGQDATLAVLDTGVDVTHPAFTRLHPSDYRDFTGTGEEDIEGHGTHVASIAAGDDPSADGVYAGIAPLSRLVVGKVVAGEAGLLENILNGMAWAVFEKRADVISLSLGDSETPANGSSVWSRACDEAFRLGTLVCVAAGNLEPAYPESLFVPADSRTAVAVGAIDPNCHLAPFSAKGSERSESPMYGKPECVAPGVGVVGARSAASSMMQVGGDPSHTALSGTSMATPAVAGCMVLLKSAARGRGWELAPPELRDLFLAACRPLVAPDGEGYRSDFEVGHGLVDMRKAIELVDQRPVAPKLVSGWGLEASPEMHPPHPQPKFSSGVCYQCESSYLSAMAFSPLWKCEICQAPICMLCWRGGRCRCRAHQKSAPSVTAGPAAREADPVPHKTPPSIHLQIDIPVCDDFLNGFEAKVRARSSFHDPLHDEDLRLDADLKRQGFNSTFGRVRFFPLRAGRLRKRTLMILAAAAWKRAGSCSRRVPGCRTRSCSG